MTKDETLRMALDAMEDCQLSKTNAAIQACEEALAQPEREWVGLTAEEANQLWESTDSDWELMKRTEAKLKQKNGYAEEKNT